MPTNGPEKSIDEILGERIRELRIASKLSPDQVAKAATMTVSDYWMGEQGIRRFSAAETFEIARSLGIELSDLVSALKKKD